ncbi:MAG: class I SAM-dependent methyltransferase [Gemmatimonadota bacterium]|nr:class I SAM-dependent methyltransferase [Gemmatimonadota bacterium]MDQ2789631.1 class I SAM-dependent methyltransferase [Actinomycetota bacterium]
MDLREMRGLPTRHPWELSRARFFRTLLADEGMLGRGSRVLDVGSGDGYVARELAAAMPGDGEVVCFDTHYSEQHLCKLKQEAGGTSRVRFTRDSPEGLFDLILLLDVIEHVEDDRALLAGLLRDRLRQGGVVLVSVPAWQALYTRHDLFLGHHRRYRPADLYRLLADVGLQQVRDGGLFHGLLLPRALEKLSELARGVRSRPGVEGLGGDKTNVAAEADGEMGIGGWNHGPSLTAAVTAALAADNVLSGLASRAGVGLPGLSTWALCRKA